MKTFPSWLLALSAVLIGIASCWYYRNAFFPFTDSSSLQVHNIADENELYGFDRLLETDGEQWLPAIEIAVNSEVKTVTNQLLDTISGKTWQDYAQQITYFPAGSNLLPLQPNGEIQLWRQEASIYPTLFHQLQTWTSFREQAWSTSWPELSNDCTTPTTTVLIFEEKSLNELTVQGHLENLSPSLVQQSALLLYFGDQKPTTLISLKLPLLWLPAANETSEIMAAQALFGAIDIKLENGQQLAATRLGHAPPESVGIDRAALSRMDKYVKQAIRRRAIPGCQVLVAKDGKIILEKSYGYHTYDKAQAVNNQDLYDLASITKVAATTLGLMRLEEQQHIQLADRLKDLLPATHKSNLHYLRLRHLLSHHTGLQSNLPIARWLNKEDSFQQEGSAAYPLALDQDFYLKAGIREAVLAQLLKLRIPRRLFYRYSDVNFLLLQEVMEHQSGQAMDHYLSTYFYEPLGLQRLRFRPGLGLPANEIIPTEYDKKWRKNLVQGEVHDESAALLGGVAGHAGLFSNARDLAVVFQLLLNDGQYGGRTYFQPETIATFTSRNKYNARAYGFDRLAAHSKSLRYYGASMETFGHTGFTGTCAWADPENDLIFIFLSNRIYPDKYNEKLQKLGLRERLHKIVYQSLNTSV